MNEEEEQIIEEFEDKGGTKLPALIKEWMQESLKYSKYNDVPAALTCLVLLGQAVKDFVHIPRGKSSDDSRLHFVWIQNSGTGKTAIMDFVLPVSDSLWNKINKENKYLPREEIQRIQRESNQDLGEDESPMTIPLQQYDNFDVVEYTDAALVGYQDPFIDEDGRTRWNHIKGELDGHGLARWDEFSNSGIFKQTQHKEGIVTYLNTLCNSLCGSSWVITKKLKEGPKVECRSQRSILATTFHPENLDKAIVNTGLFQRALVLVKFVPEEKQRKIRETIVQNFGIIEESTLPIERFASALFKVYQTTKQRFEQTSLDPRNKTGENDARFTIRFAPNFNDALLMRLDDMDAWSDSSVGTIRDIVKNFQTRWLGLLGKISILCCIAEANSIKKEEERFVVNARNVNQAAFIVRNCYKSLIEWLELSLQQGKADALNSTMNGSIMKAYQALEKNEEGFVPKKEFINKIMEISKRKQAIVYRHFKKISNNFEEKKIDKKAFVRLKGE